MAQGAGASHSCPSARLMLTPVLLLSCSCLAGGWKAPKTPLLAVPLNMTAGYRMWQNMDTALSWARKWVKGKPILA